MHQTPFAHSRDHLSGPISRDIAILSLRYPTSRDAFAGSLALPQNGAIPRPPPPSGTFSHRHICAIPPFCNISQDNCAMPPPKTSTKEFYDTIAASIPRYESEGREWGVGSVVVGSAFGAPQMFALNRSETLQNKGLGAI